MHNAFIGELAVQSQAGFYDEVIPAVVVANGRDPLAALRGGKPAIGGSYSDSRHG